MPRRWVMSVLPALLAAAVLFGVAVLVGGRMTGVWAGALLVVVLGLLFAARFLGPAGGGLDARDADGG